MQEVEAAQLAEKGQLEEALLVFTEVVTVAPLRGSGYNNRAQLHQLRGDLAAAQADLDHAIQACVMPTEVARMAYSQRAVLHRVQGRDEAARHDFEQAARLGDAWARRMAVKLNPYAALCNQMLAQAMRELQGLPPAPEVVPTAACVQPTVPAAVDAAAGTGAPQS